MPKKKDPPAFYVWHTDLGPVIYYAKRTNDGIEWVTDIEQASLFSNSEGYQMKQEASYNWECSYTHKDYMNQTFS